MNSLAFKIAKRVYELSKEIPLTDKDIKQVISQEEKEYLTKSLLYCPYCENQLDYIGIPPSETEWYNKPDDIRP